MILKNISLTNFMGWSKLDIPLGDYTGVTAILGMIDGDPSRSNGTGKTSLMTALVFALYGKQVTKNMDELIMQGKEDLGFKVVLQLEHKGIIYEITRKKKAGSPQKVQLKDITHNSILDMDPEELLGMPLAVWNNTIYSAQGNLAGIVSQSPSARKDMLTEIFGMKNYLELEETARSLRTSVDNRMIQEQAGADVLTAQANRITVSDADIASVDARLQQCGSELAAIQEQLISLKAELSVLDTACSQDAALATKLSEVESEYSRLSGKELATISDYAQKKAALQQAIKAAADKVELYSSKMHTREKLEQLHEAKLAAEKAGEELKTATLELEDITGKIAKQESALQVLRYRLTQLGEAKDSFSKLGDVCPTCGNTITEEHTRAHLAELDLELNKTSAEAAALEADLHNSCILEHTCREAVAALKAVQGRLVDIEADLHHAEILSKDLAHATEAMADLNEQLKSLEAGHMRYLVEVAEAKSLLTGKRDSLVKEREALAEVGAKGRDLRQRLITLTQAEQSKASDRDDLLRSKHSLQASLEERTRLLNQVSDILVRLSALSEEKEVYGELVKAFGPSGIPTLILETCLSDLQSYLDSYMDLLSDGRIKVTFRTTKVSASTNKVSETLSILVSDINGERDIAFYSGGERVRICLAIRLALSRLIANRSGVQTGLLLIDEVSDLDEAGLNSFIQLLRSVSGEFTQIFLVSHLSELKNAFSGSLVLHRDLYGNYVRS